MKQAVAEEIERKFLVEQPDWQSDAEVIAVTDIEQGYLCADERRSLRIRIRGEAATLAVKGATRGITRQEFEYEIPVDDARALLALCGGLRLSKRRYDVRYGGRNWEVDVFSASNAGLVVAEIELDDANEVFEKPGWVGPEISEDPRYYNSNLARKPFSRWSDAR